MKAFFSKTLIAVKISIMKKYVVFFKSYSFIPESKLSPPDLPDGRYRYRYRYRYRLRHVHVHRFRLPQPSVSHVIMEKSTKAKIAFILKKEKKKKMINCFPEAK